MKISPSTLLQLPSGATGLFLHEAHSHRRQVEKLNQLYDSWAYLPVHTPLLDFSEAYTGLVSEADAKRVYQMFDRDGHLLMLRWDITLFLVKQIRSMLSPKCPVLRLCYADSIMRHEDAEDIARNEFFQTGVELIGKPGLEGDLEVLLLLQQAFEALRLRPSVHVGSHSLIDAVSTELNSLQKEELSHAIKYRDQAQIEALLGPNLASDAKLFSLICPAAQAPEVLAPHLKSIKPASRDAVEQLLTLLSNLLDIEPSFDLHLDCSEIGSQGYHSGMVFQAYLDGISGPAAAGGRYDRLLERLGSPSPAAGFSIMLSRLLAVLPESAQSELYHAQGSTFQERVADAKRERQQGRRVSL